LPKGSQEAYIQESSSWVFLSKFSSRSFTSWDSTPTTEKNRFEAHSSCTLLQDEQNDNKFLQCMQKATGLEPYDKEKQNHERETEQNRIK
jgi:hypothetical protein